MISCLDLLLSDEACPKSLYLKLLKLIESSEILMDEFSDTLSKYFDKFKFRYGFRELELKKLNQFFKKYVHRRSAK